MEPAGNVTDQEVFGWNAKFVMGEGTKLSFVKSVPGQAPILRSQGRANDVAPRVPWRTGVNAPAAKGTNYKRSSQQLAPSVQGMDPFA